MVPNGTITELCISNNPTYLARVRRIIGCLAENVGLDERECYDTKLAVTEACANAIRHGANNCANDRITIRLHTQSGSLTAEISDNGHGFDPCAERTTKSPQIGGYGIPLMKTLADKVEYLTGAHGTTVRLVKYARKSRRVTANKPR